MLAFSVLLETHCVSKVFQPLAALELRTLLASFFCADCHLLFNYPITRFPDHPMGTPRFIPSSKGLKRNIPISIIFGLAKLLIAICHLLFNDPFTRVPDHPIATPLAHPKF